jgi:nitroreductase
MPTHVPRDLIEHVVEVARRAPTAGFAQGIDFLVLDDPDAVTRFWELTGDPGDPAVAPVVVLVLSDPLRYLDRYSEPDKIEFGLDQASAWPVPFWDVDAGMAAMLLLLAAVDCGLGAWFFGVDEGVDVLRRELAIPDDRNLVGVVGMGFADPHEVPSGSGVTRPRRPLAEQLHHNRW